MAKQIEARFKERVIKDLRSLPLCYVDKIQQRSKKGSPDLYICLVGIFIGMELKRNKKCPADALQIHMLTCISNAGGLALLCYPENWDASFQFLKKTAQEALKKLGLEEIPRSNEDH